MTGIIRLHFLLDTVAAIARLNTDPAIIALLNADVDVSIPVITIGELYAGAEKASRAEENIQRVDKLIEGADLVLCDQKTAREYGRIADGLRKKGRPIPQNDMWIAALAIQHRLTLLTRDGHFSHVDGLLLKAW